MDQFVLLRRIAETLERLRIRYAFLGAFANGEWGTPRPASEIDVLVDIDVFDARAICHAFPPPEFDVSTAAADKAAESQGHFRIVEFASGGKVNLRVCGGSPWSQSQLDRAVETPLLGNQTIRVATPEDLILGKLLCFQDGGAEEHVRDIVGILAAGVPPVDRGYVLRQAERVGVAEEWRSILDKLEAI